jgi:hypothetical protein
MMLEQSRNRLDFFWPDAQVERLEADYNDVSLKISNSGRGQVTIRCRGHIGLQWLGHWDETIVERGELLDRHEFIQACRATITERAGMADSGSPLRNSLDFRLLRVVFIDGCELLIVASQFEVAK